MSALVAEINDQEFTQLVEQGQDTYIVDFWAPWCGPCRIIAPILEELATDYDGKIKVAKINVDNNTQVAAKFGISSIPTIMIFKGGEMKERITGAVPKPTLKQAIDKHL